MSEPKTVVPVALPAIRTILIDAIRTTMIEMIGGRLMFVAGSRPTALEIGDFDGDGKPDLIVANAGSNDVSVLLNTSP